MLLQEVHLTSCCAQRNQLRLRSYPGNSGPAFELSTNSDKQDRHIGMSGVNSRLHTCRRKLVSNQHSLLLPAPVPPHAWRFAHHTQTTPATTTTRTTHPAAAVHSHLLNTSWDCRCPVAPAGLNSAAEPSANTTDSRREGSQ